MLWFTCFLVFFTSLFSAMLLANSAQRLKLLAVPGEHRLHSQATPMVGGLAMCVAVVIGILLAAPAHAPLLLPLVFICLVGALDDRYKLPSWLRFIAQAIAASAMVYFSGSELLSLGALKPGQEVVLGHWSVPMTVFATIGVINAINMSDGIDGLAGSLVVLILIALLFITGTNSNLILIIAFAVAGFLFWNLRIFRSSAKMFMGDAGSTMLGLLLAYLLIECSQIKQGIKPVTALWLTAIPLIDAVAVLIVRPLRGKSPFAADRIHYHHQLLDRSVSNNHTLLIALGMQVVFVIIGVLALNMNIAEHLQLRAFLSVFGLYFLSLLWFTRKA